MLALSAFPTWILLVQSAASLAMTGLIWFVQVVHYPLFANVGSDQFETYESAHRWRTTVVVGPLMISEALTAILILLSPPAGVSRGLALLGVVLLAMALGSTMLFSVPMHDRLNLGFETAAHRRLVATNWIRTFAWSGRGIVALVMMNKVFELRH